MVYKQQSTNDPDRSRPHSSPKVEASDLLILQDKATQCDLNLRSFSDEELRKLGLMRIPNIQNKPNIYPSSKTGKKSETRFEETENSQSSEESNKTNQSCSEQICILMKFLNDQESKKRKVKKQNFSKLNLKPKKPDYRLKIVRLVNSKIKKMMEIRKRDSIGKDGDLIQRIVSENVEELYDLELKKSGYLNNEDVKGFTKSSAWMACFNSAVDLLFEGRSACELCSALKILCCESDKHTSACDEMWKDLHTWTKFELFGSFNNFNLV